MERNKIYCGDWVEIAKQLEPNSIDCIITSPPYYGLRDYGTARWEGGNPECDHMPPNSFGLEYMGDKYKCSPSKGYKKKCAKCGAVKIDKQLGQEKTPEEFIQNLVTGFRILRDALKDTGTLWVNMGDSYWGGKGQNGNSKARNTAEERGYKQSGGTPSAPFRNLDGKHDSIKPKDLIGIPWMLALALRADGWYLRQDIIWSKPNPTPESVKDRCTKSHEYIFLLSKSKQYYFDNEAIKEPAEYADSKLKSKKEGEFNGKTNGSGYQEAFRAIKQTRNKRSVWTVPPKPFKDAHFAAFPHELIDPCILSGTSEKGCCPTCGKPWERILEDVIKFENNGKTKSTYPEGSASNRLALKRQAARENGTETISAKKTVGWEPTCKCGKEFTVPAIVYDPFMGSGTTASAAKSLGRDYMGSELNPDYIKIKDGRLNKELGLFNL